MLEVPYGVVDKIAKLIPEGPGQTLAECLKPNGELRKAVDGDPVAKEILELAQPLEGLTRADSIHAAGVVIGAEPLTNIVPLQQKGADQEVVTQFPMKDIEALGLLKMDFLGLRNLDVIDKACELLGDLDISAIPMDDKKTYAMLARGEATGVFQFESSGMREALRQVKPTEFEDLIALVALYRPGPMQYIPTYANRKNGKEAVSYIDPRLKPITGNTFAISIYQEQSLQIASEIAGFSLFEAEDLRRAISKKDHKLMASLKTKFIEGCITNGASEQVSKQLWDDMEKSQDYSFNKSHAACYALIAYQTAWLRANHPCEYMAALISSVMSTKDRVPFYVNACHELGIEVLPPDVNESQTDFAVVEGKIRFGLNAVKGVGETACRAIIAARDEGPIESLWDFTERVDPAVANRRVVEALVKCGALPGSRKGMLAVLDDALRLGQKFQADRLAGQGSIFDLDPTDEKPRKHPPIATDEFEKNELLAMEKEVLGLYVTEHPLSEIRDQLRRKADTTIAELDRRRDGEVVIVGGIVTAMRQMTTKRGEAMVFLRVEDVTGGVDTVVFNSDLRQLTRALHDRPDPDRQGPRRPQGGRDEARRDGGGGVRGRPREARGAAQGRRHHHPGGDHPRARPADPGLPRRVTGVRRLPHLAGAQDLRLRPAAQGTARPRLLRRGENAARRVGDRVKSPRPKTRSLRVNGGRIASERLAVRKACESPTVGRTHIVV